MTLIQNPIPGSGTVTLYGGDVNKEIAAYKIKAINSDLRIKRFIFQFGTGGVDFPWRDISTLSIWDGTTLVKEISASSANFAEITFATTYTFQIDGLDVLVTKDTEKVLSLKATALSIPQYIGNITVLIPANGVRATDSTGLNVYGPGAALGIHTFAAALALAPTVTVTADSANPAAGNVIASITDVSRTDLMKININVVGVNMTFKGGSITLTTDSNDILSGLELYDDTTLLASAADPGPGATATWSTYTLAVPAGTSKVLTVKGVLPANPAASSQLKLDMPATTGLTGIDSNGTARNNGATGAVAGNTQRVYTIAPTFAYSTSGYTVSGSNPNGGHPNDLGSASISFTVTANGGDIYIATTTTMTDTLNGGTASAVAATGVITFTTNPTAAGTAKVTISGTDVTYNYSTTSADTISTVASGIVTAIGANATTTALVAATSSAGVVNLTAKTAGYAGNSITYSATTTASTGITVTPIASTNMTGGINATASSDAWSCNTPGETTTNANFWRIPNGNTATCTFTDQITNTNTSAAGWFQPTLTNISWMTSATTTGGIDQNWGLTTLKTSQFYLGI